MAAAAAVAQEAKQELMVDLAVVVLAVTPLGQAVQETRLLQVHHKEITEETEPQGQITVVEVVVVLGQLVLMQQGLQEAMAAMEQPQLFQDRLHLTQVVVVVEPIKVEPLARGEQAVEAMAAQQAQIAPELLAQQILVEVVGVRLIKVRQLLDRQAAQES